MLIGLNAASFVQKVREPDNEVTPNRSTYNSGTTGTRAFYTMLEETGRPVVRWQQPPDNLQIAGEKKPTTFIVIGPLRREFSENDIARLLEWVNGGGRLIVIDRDPQAAFLATTANWIITFSGDAAPNIGTDPGNQPEMTVDTIAARPKQPTIYTQNVIAAQPSRFAAAINIKRDKSFFTPEDTSNYQNEDATESNTAQTAGTSAANQGTHDFFKSEGTDASVDEMGNTPQSADDDEAVPEDEETTDELEAAWFKGPVAHMASGDRDMLVDVPYGAGEIVYLSDPFIVANGGIDMADNARLAINLAASRNGIIAFDEYHHGYGAGNNRILEYFEATPVTAIFLQLAALAAFAFYSQSRRFARPVPMPEPDRRSKLEYISAMAELQQRTRAYDLAIENIYTDFHRRAARIFGLDGVRADRRELAERIAERISVEPDDVEALMRRCEDIIHGDAAKKREAAELARRIREIEALLKLRRAGRAGR